MVNFKGSWDFWSVGEAEVKIFIERKTHYFKEARENIPPHTHTLFSSCGINHALPCKMHAQNAG